MTSKIEQVAEILRKRPEFLVQVHDYGFGVAVAVEANGSRMGVRTPYPGSAGYISLMEKPAGQIANAYSRALDEWSASVSLIVDGGEHGRIKSNG